ncbi:MAG: hypothetical protein JWM31_1354 [Solirubrobacterales bacterium]|nr:hypothetical protein [Solirubrobacterales bacterium]
MSPDAQRMHALALANKRRLAGAHIKSDLAAGRITFDQALRDPRAEAVRVVDLINALWGWGPNKVTSVATQLQLGPKTRVRDLSKRRVVQIGHEVAARHDQIARMRERRQRRVARRQVAA